MKNQSSNQGKKEYRAPVGMNGKSDEIILTKFNIHRFKEEYALLAQSKFGVIASVFCETKDLQPELIQALPVFQKYNMARNNQNAINAIDIDEEEYDEDFEDGNDDRIEDEINLDNLESLVNHGSLTADTNENNNNNGEAEAEAEDNGIDNTNNQPGNEVINAVYVKEFAKKSIMIRGDLIGHLSKESLHLLQAVPNYKTLYNTCDLHGLWINIIKTHTVVIMNNDDRMIDTDTALKRFKKDINKPLASYNVLFTEKLKTALYNGNKYQMNTIIRMYIRSLDSNFLQHRTILDSNKQMMPKTFAAIKEYALRVYNAIENNNNNNNRNNNNRNKHHANNNNKNNTSNNSDNYNVAAMVGSKNNNNNKVKGNQTNICKHYVNGKCNRGNTCSYKHEKGICRYDFNGGRCNSGDACKYKHVSSINNNTNNNKSNGNVNMTSSNNTSTSNNNNNTGNNSNNNGNVNAVSGNINTGNNNTSNNGNNVTTGMTMVVLSSTGDIGNTNLWFFDPGSTYHLTNDLSDLTDVVTIDKFYLNAYTNDKIEVTHKGRIGVIDNVYYTPNGKYKLLSGTVVDNTPELTWYKEANNTLCKIKHSSDNELIFKCNHGLYICSTDDITNFNNNIHGVVTAVMSSTEVTRAKQVRLLQHKLAFPSDTMLIKTLASNSIINCPLNTNDVRNAFDLLGPSDNYLIGGIKRHAAVTSHTDPVYNIGERLDNDPFTYHGVDFLLSVDEKTCNLVVVHMKSNKEVDILSYFKQIIGLYKSHRKDVKRVVTDQYASLKALKDELQLMGILLQHPPVEQHVKRAERYISIIKARCDAVMSTLGYLLPKQLLIYLVFYVVECLNRTTNVNTIGSTPNYEITNVKMDYIHDLKGSFGDIVVVRNTYQKQHPDKPHGSYAIIVKRKWDQHSTVVVYKLDDKQLLESSDFVVIHLTQDIKKIIETSHAQFVNREFLLFDPIDDADTFNGDILRSFGLDTKLFTVESSNNDTTDNNNNNELPNPYIIKPHVSNYNLRNKHNAINLVATDDGGYTLTAHPSSIKEARMLELSAFIRNKVMHPVLPKERSDNSVTIPTHMIDSIKTDPNMKESFHKSRLVSNGKLMNRDLFQNRGCATPDSKGIFAFIANALNTGSNLFVLDISNAFLKVPRPTDGDTPTVYVTVNADIVELLIELVPNWKKYILSNGKMMLQLDRAMYGTLDAAKLFVDDVNKTLTSNNYQQCATDTCLYKKGNFKTIHQIDDFLSSYTNSTEKDEFLNMMKDRYENILL